jgi:hypothetical protein
MSLAFQQVFGLHGIGWHFLSISVEFRYPAFKSSKQERQPPYRRATPNSDGFHDAYVCIVAQMISPMRMFVLQLI